MKVASALHLTFAEYIKFAIDYIVAIMEIMMMMIV